jgi:hypothetical protein
MATNLSVTINLKKDEPRGVTQRVMQRAIDLSAIELKGNLQRNSPVDDGKMQGSWFISSAMPKFQSKVFSSAIYTPFVNYGTGIYGPRGRKIYPKTKKFLAFNYKGKKVVVPWIRGQKPRKFVEKSITQTERRSDEFVIRAMLEFQGALSE